MMYRKAMLFEDFEYVKKILSSKDTYGRLVRGFDENKLN